MVPTRGSRGPATWLPQLDAGRTGIIGIAHSGRRPHPGQNLQDFFDCIKCIDNGMRINGRQATFIAFRRAPSCPLLATCLKVCGLSDCADLFDQLLRSQSGFHFPCNAVAPGLALRMVALRRWYCTGFLEERKSDAGLRQLLLKLRQEAVKVDLILYPDNRNAGVVEFKDFYGRPSLVRMGHAMLVVNAVVDYQLGRTVMAILATTCADRPG